jgi:hypothetical protein
MAENNKVTELYCYEPELKAIVEGEDKPIDISYSLKGLQIHNNYSEQTFPFVVTKAILSKEHRKLVQDNADNILFSLNLKKFNQDDEEVEWNKNYFENVLFKPVDPEKTEIPLIDQEIKDIEDISGNNPEYPITLYLFKKEHLMVNKKLTTKVYVETTMHDVLLKLVEENFQSDDMKFHIGKVDNNKKYEQIIIPPLTFAKSIKHLQKCYGIFNGGAQVFCDFKDGWIIDPQKVIEGKDPEESVVNASLELYHDFNEKNKGPGLLNCSGLDKENNKYLIKTSNLARLQSPKTALKEVIGEAVKFISNTIKANSEINCVDMTFDTNTNDKKAPKEAIYWNPFSHAMAESEFKVNISNTFNKMLLTLTDLDLESLSINRLFEVNNKKDEEDPLELNGSWKCDSVIHTLIRPSTGKMVLNSNGNFRKLRYIP